MAGVTYKMPLHGEWVTFTEEDLRNLDFKPQGLTGEALWAEYEKYCDNRLAYFLGHGQQCEFINDREHKLTILTAGNRNGKTQAGLIWDCVRIFPCDPDWMCFKEHGLKWYPHDGVFNVLLASYSFDHCRSLFWDDGLAELVPMEFLREYHPEYEGKGKKSISWTNRPILPLKFDRHHKVNVRFGAYNQSQSQFEGFEYKYVHSDEQAPPNIITGIFERGRAAGGMQSLSPPRLTV